MTWPWPICARRCGRRPTGSCRRPFSAIRDTWAPGWSWKIQAASGLPLKAAQTFQAVFAHDPDNAEACLQLSQIHQSQQLPDAALQFARKAAALKPNEWRYQTALALLLLSRGSYDEAAARLAAASKARPGDAYVLQALGVAYLQQGRRTEAVQVLERAVVQQPDNAALYQHLGEAYLVVNRPRDAVATLRQAIGWNPSVPQAHINLGYAYMALAETEAARQAFERAVALDPGLSGRVRPGIP